MEKVWKNYLLRIKYITPLTKEYKDFIHEMENTPSEIFYRDGERRFSKEQEKFFDIYMYKQKKYYENIKITPEINNMFQEIKNNFSLKEQGLIYYQINHNPRDLTRHYFLENYIANSEIKKEQLNKVNNFLNENLNGDSEKEESLKKAMNIDSNFIEKIEILKKLFIFYEKLDFDEKEKVSYWDINQIAEKEANYHSLYNHGIKQNQNLQNMDNTQEINKEKINSFVNDVIFTQKNETEQEHTERYTQMWNELNGDEKAYVQEKGADIAVSSIGEAYYEDTFMPREKENEIIADFNSKIEKLSSEEVVTKKHNEPKKEFDITEHLNNQMKYLGFGDNHKEEIQKGIDSNDKSFQIKTTSDRVMEGNQVDFAINFNKLEKGGVFLNSFDARLITQDGEERSHNFKLNFTAKEAINLLEGRAVKTEFNNSKTNEPFEAFVRLKFNEPKNEYDNYKLEFHKANEIDTAKIVELSGLKFEKPEYKDFVIKSLEKGNITNVKFTHEGNEIEGKAVLNPQYKNLNLYDKDMNRLNTNKPL